jgi:hypothetical protein
MVSGDCVRRPFNAKSTPIKLLSVRKRYEWARVVIYNPTVRLAAGASGGLNGRRIKLCREWPLLYASAHLDNKGAVH